jgi:hypothetical protein
MLLLLSKIPVISEQNRIFRKLPRGQFVFPVTQLQSFFKKKNLAAVTLQSQVAVAMNGDPM